jgi:peptide subunit release factor RF-3
VSNCVHHWVIESDGGQVVTGVCKHCNEEKQFNGFISYGPESYKRINTMNANEKKKMRVGIHLPGSPPLRNNEMAW